VLSVGVVLLALAGAWTVPRSAIPDATAAAPIDPNVVVILTDDQTAASLDYHPPGYPSAMPFLQDRLADPADHWVRFDNAFVNTALCCPSRATILTGQNSHHTGVLTNKEARLFRESATVAAWLQADGYWTGFFGKYLNGWPFNRGNYTPPGWDRAALFDYRLGPDAYYDYGLVNGTVVERYGRTRSAYLTDVLAAKAARFISDAPTGRPFFLFLTPIAGHHPWTAAPRHVNRFAGAPPARTPNFNEADVSDKPAWIRALPTLTAAQQARWDDLRRRSAESLTAADDAIRRVVTELTAKGVLEDTVIIVTSDHGHTFGEHRLTRKRCPYEECVRIPLLIRYPGAAAGSVETLAGNVDIAATLVDLAGTTATIPMDGRSLVPALEGAPTSWREGILLHDEADRCAAGSDCLPAYWGIRTQDYTYVEYQTGERELYDLTGRVGRADPYQLTNRAADPAYADVRANLADLLRRLRS
jgi:N-acetylglucosamine-6-sulfatase